ncbi:MAG: hypothetical protein QOG72_1272 [Sphingomonadales bacterium]|jgi:hypothetical protein|nr:hypothetical protein [Sphingomonadales bacterium]
MVSKRQRPKAKKSRMAIAPAARQISAENPQAGHKTGWPTLVAHRPKLAKAAAGAIAIFGAYAAWASLQPVITVEVQPIVTIDDQTSPLFIVRNNGWLAARNVGFGCVDWGRYNRAAGAIWPQDWKHKTEPPRKAIYDNIGVLDPGTQVPRRCIVQDPPPGFTRTDGSKLIPIVTYRSSLNPWTSTRSFFFERDKSSDNQIIWTFWGTGLSPSEAAAVRKQGHPTYHLNFQTEDIDVEPPE